MSNTWYRVIRSAAAIVAIGAVTALAIPATASAEGSADSASAGDVVGSVEGSVEGLGAVDVDAALSNINSILIHATSIANSVAGGDVNNIINSVVSAASSGSLAPVQQCNAKTVSGGAGVTDTQHELGRTGPTSFVLTYETYAIPDQIEVFYDGRRIHNTGYVGDNLNQGTGSTVVTVPAGRATSVLVRVTGPNYTDWDYSVRCP